MHMEMDSMTIGVLVFFGILAGCVLLISAVQTFRQFRQELRYINIEISRNVGTERRYWQRQKRRLWRMLLPFYKKRY